MSLVVWVAIALAVVWLVLLTVTVLRLWLRHGEPVFRRLGNGRIRFTWGVLHSYNDVRRRHDVTAGDHGQVTVDVLLGHRDQRPPREPTRFDSTAATIPIWEERPPHAFRCR